MLCHIAFYGFCNFLLVDDLMKVFDNVFSGVLKMAYCFFEWFVGVDIALQLVR